MKRYVYTGLIKWNSICELKKQDEISMLDKCFSLCKAKLDIQKQQKTSKLQMIYRKSLVYEKAKKLGNV